MVHGWAGFIIIWQSTEAFGRVSFPGLLALFALEIWCIISFDLVSGSYLFYVWVLLVEYSHWILREMTWSMGAMLGSTVDMGRDCDSTWLLDEFHTISALRQTRILKCCSPFGCRTEKRAQSMLLVAVSLCAVRTRKP